MQCVKISIAFMILSFKWLPPQWRSYICCLNIFFVGIQNQPDLVQPSSQGRGNHQHEMGHILMVTHIGSHFLHHYGPRFPIGFLLTRLINFTDDIVEQITYTTNYFVGNFEIFGRWG
jgi:hypothetical protein